MSDHHHRVRKAESYDDLIKLLLIGNSGVGKSSILLRYFDDEFTPNFITTIGLDFRIKTVDVDGKRVKLQVWDTAGQERFRTITTAYYRGAMGIFLVYDVLSEESFENVRGWIRQIDEHASRNVVCVLLANKSDTSAEERRVTQEQGAQLAAEYGIQFFETSAKLDANIEQAFLAMARQVLKQKNEKIPPVVPFPPRVPPGSPRCCSV